MLEIILVLLFIFFFLFLLLAYQYYRDFKIKVYSKKVKIKKVEIPSSIDLQHCLYLVKQGYFYRDELLNAISADNGSSWYVIHNGDDDINEAIPLEEKHPHVLINPYEWDKLKRYVKKNGPITLEDEIGLSLLEEAGFEIRTRYL